MRLLGVFALISLLSTSSVFAQPGENEIRKLKAEITRLREENIHLKKRLHAFELYANRLRKIRDEERKLEGVWLIEKATRDGITRGQEKGGEVEFRGNRAIVRFPKRKELIRMEVRFDPTAKPKRIAFYPLSPGTPTNSALDLSRGIYEMEKGTLRICLESFYPSGRRDFSDKGQVRWILKRKKR